MAFDLSSIHHGKKNAPPRIVLYGDHGIGKSTFAAGAPKPIFICTEDGLGNIDSASFPLCMSYKNALGCVHTLYKEKHDFQTVVLDSLDWLEALVWTHVAKAHGHKEIEDFGYGKGYAFAADTMRDFLRGLNALRTEKKMAVILTAHCQVKRFDDPTSEPYDRYILKLHKSASSIVSEWADVIGFAQNDTRVQKEDVGFNKKARRAVSSGKRWLNVERTPAFDAKNRLGLPAKMPLEWAAFDTAMRAAS